MAILSDYIEIGLASLTNVPNLLLLSIIMKFPFSYLIKACSLDTDMSDILISH